MLMNIYNATAEGHFCSEGRKAIKQQIFVDYAHYMGNVDTGNNGQQLLHQLAHIQVDKKNCSFVCLTWPFSIATFSFLMWG